MKAVALLLCGLGLVVANSNNNNYNYDDNNNNNNNQQKADKNFLQKQVQLFHLFMNPHQPSGSQEQQQANNFSFQQQQQRSNNANAVKHFQNAYQQGFLPRGEVFNYNNPNHLQQAIQLFDLFYFAKDYQTFYQAACWARNNINEGQFHYAYSVAILNRPDTQGVAMPPQAEIHPTYYVNGQAIHQAHNYKQQGQKQFYVQSNHTSNYAYNQQQRYQQQQQQQDDFPFNNQYQNQYDNEFRANQYQNQKQYNEEGRISYYNEDINLNQQYAFEQLKNPAFFNNQKYQNKQQNQNQNSGENFYYYLQQTLARYNLERHANDLPNVQPFQFNQTIQPGYNPQLKYFNGQFAPARPNNMDVNNANPNYYEQFQKIDRRVADVADSHQAKAADGSKVQLNSKNGIEILGNIVQNNYESPNNQYYAANNGYYGLFDQCRRVVASTVNPDNQYDNAPAAIDMDHTANRDPAFYQCVSRVVNYFQNFKNQQKPYNQEQLNFQGVKVQSVNTDKLVTYFDNAEVDLFNALGYQQGEEAQKNDYKAYQMQLNNKPFNYQIQVNSDKNTNAVVRVFIGPKYDAQGQQYSLEQARQNFVEIDRFTVNLKNGQNNIQRNSQQSTRFVQQQGNSRQMFNQFMQAQQGGQAYYYNQYYAQQEAKFPQNLILPKGTRYGQEYVFAVAVNAYQGNQPDQNQNQQDQPNDNRPQGFPFDRVVRDADFQQAQNIYFRTVKVFNKNQSEVNNNDN